MDIKIISAPPGQAPDWVKEGWVGLILPVAKDVPSEGTRVAGVLGGPVQNPGGYSVRTNIAIEILKERNPKAAEWWNKHVSPDRMPWLVFSKDVCQVVS